MLRLPDKPTLRDVQDYVAAMTKERGFDSETHAERVMLFLEEAGEMAKAVRKIQGVKMDANSAQHNLEHEIADVLIMLVCIANQLDVDMEKAFRDKEEINKQRTWT